MKQRKDWDNFQKGIDYNRRLPTDYFNLCDTNANMDAGEQWLNADVDPDFLLATVNIINKATTFFIAYIASSDIALRYNSLIDLDENDISDRILNATWDEWTEKVKFSKKYRQALKDGTITGDYIAHLVWKDRKLYGGAFGNYRGEIDLDLIDATNFYVAEPSKTNDFWEFQEQEYIQIGGRSLVKKLKEEQKNMKELLTSDKDTETQMGMYGDIELDPILADNGQEEGSATWVLTYYKKDVEEETGEFDEDGDPITETVQKVFSSKCTETGYIYKDNPEEIDYYPVVLGNWIEQKNTWHGQSFVKNMVPMQIYINQGFTLAMKHTQDTAFSKFFYNMDMLEEGLSVDVSSQVGVRLKAGQRIDDVGKYMMPGSMDDNIIRLIDMGYNYIKDVVGLTDALTGNVNPEQASGVSIVSSAKQAGIPIEVPKMNSYDWVEDIGRVFKNMVENLYGERPVILEENGKRVVGTYDFSQFKRMFKEPKLDVGESSYWSEDNMIKILDNLLSQQIIDTIFYLEHIPAGKIPGQEKLLEDLKARLPQDTEIPPEVDAQLTETAQLQPTNTDVIL